MVRVSHKKLQEKALKKLHARFAQSIVKVNSKHDASLFLEELLGDEELLMLSKRLAAIYMLAENVSAYRIAQVLGLSTSTVNRLHQIFVNDGYNSIVLNYKHKKNHAQFWEDVDLLLRLGMPPRGKTRWQWLNEMEKRER